MIRITANENKLEIHGTIQPFDKYQQTNDVYQIEQRLQAFGDITSLCINNSNIGSDNTSTITYIFQLLRNYELDITTLTLDRCNYETNESLRQIYDAINTSCPNVTSLKVSGSSLENDGAVVLASYLLSNHSLTSLHLNDATITSSGVAAIAQSLLANYSLTNLHLAYCEIGADAARSIGGIFQTNILNKVRLHNNALQGEALSELSKALASNTSIAEIVIGMYFYKKGDYLITNFTFIVGNQLEAVGVMEIARALAANSSITDANLGISYGEQQNRTYFIYRIQSHGFTGSCFHCKCTPHQ